MQHHIVIVGGLDSIGYYLARELLRTKYIVTLVDDPKQYPVSEKNYSDRIAELGQLGKFYYVNCYYGFSEYVRKEIHCIIYCDYLASKEISLLNPMIILECSRLAINKNVPFVFLSSYLRYTYGYKAEINSFSVDDSRCIRLFDWYSQLRYLLGENFAENELKDTGVLLVVPVFWWLYGDDFDCSMERSRIDTFLEYSFDDVSLERSKFDVVLPENCETLNHHPYQTSVSNAVLIIKRLLLLIVDVKARMVFKRTFQENENVSERSKNIFKFDVGFESGKSTFGIIKERAEELSRAVVVRDIECHENIANLFNGMPNLEKMYKYFPIN